MRDHKPVTIDKFNGLYQRGDADNTPLDHFADGENFKLIGDSSFTTRDGIGISQDVNVPLSNIKRIYNYPTQIGNTLIVLVLDSFNIGHIFHVVNSTLVYGPILSITGMTDFAFIPYAGRAYISPFSTFVVNGLNIEKGLPGQFLYVYAGDGTVARPSAGNSLSGTLTIANGAIGHTDAGFHLFGFVSETISGYLSPPGVITGFTTVAGQSVSFGNIPINYVDVNINNVLGQFIPQFDNEEEDEEESIFLSSPTNKYVLALTEKDESDNLLTIYPFDIYSFTKIADPYIVKRHLVATRVITGYSGDPLGYTFYFVPNATINNNTDTFLNDISFYDADLLEDASHLLDNYGRIPAGAVLSLYHNRLCLFTTYTDISIGLISLPGEPEAISQIDGLIIVPLDGNPITNAQELRDILYVMKRSRTVAFVDSGDVPSLWPMNVIDNALGTSVHGIATVIDSGSSSVDYLIIATYQGISLFNGRYISPELSWKMNNYWKSLNRNEFRKIQILNASIQKDIYIILPNRKLLVGNYSIGMDQMKIKWSIWSYQMGVNTISVWNIDEIILGADLI